jgi:2-polyprenyl-6-methoxyphenol hydroxylase-like FAD-dependent oxidoreductase
MAAFARGAENFAGVVEDILRRTIPVDLVTVYTDGTRVADIELRQNFGSRFEYGAVLEQWSTEEALTAYLVREQISIWRGYEVTALSKEGDASMSVQLRTNTCSQSLHGTW